MAERSPKRPAPKPMKKGIKRIRRERTEFLRGLTKPVQGRFGKRRPKK